MVWYAIIYHFLLITEYFCANRSTQKAITLSLLVISGKNTSNTAHASATTCICREVTWRKEKVKFYDFIIYY